MRIDDGEGSGIQVGVNDRNEIKARARILTQEDAEVLNGNLYFVLTDAIALTSATEQGMLYIKNTSTALSILIHHALTGGLGHQVWRAYAKPTGGTLISDANLATVTNANLQSGNELDALVYKPSADGKTVTGGDLIANWIAGAGIPTDVAGGTILIGPGQSLAITLEASSAAKYNASLLVTQEDLS